MVITRDAYEKMIAHAKSLFPIEACGYVGGADDIYSTVYTMKNIDNSEEHFSFSPEEQVQTFLEAKKAGLRLGVVFHSHPYTPARPSEEDIRLAIDSRVIYIIISLMNETPDMKAFHIENGTVTPERIELYEK